METSGKRRGLRAHLTYANVVSTLCLFLLLGGGAYAASELTRDSVKSKHIKNESVKTADIGALSSSEVVKLDVGESEVLMEQSPFRVTLTCRVEDQNKGVAELFAESSSPGSLWWPGGGGPDATIPPTKMIAQAIRPLDGPSLLEFGVRNLVLASPEGTTVTGTFGFAVNEFGSDCIGFAMGVGGTGEPYEEG